MYRPGRAPVRGRSGELQRLRDGWAYITPAGDVEPLGVHVLDADAVRAKFGAGATFDGFEAVVPASHASTLPPPEDGAT